MTKKKDIFDGLVLPTDEEIKNETKRKVVSDKLKGKSRPKAHCDAISRSLKGHPVTSKQKTMISESLLGVTKGIKKRTTICPHCGLEGGISTMTRFHFNNCKTRNILIGTNIKTGKTLKLSGNAEIKKHGFSYGNIIGCLNGVRKSHKGYTWKRKE